MSDFRLPDSLKDIKKQDIKDSAKRIVACAIEHKVELKITYDKNEENYVYFSWGTDDLDYKTAQCLSLCGTLEFHKSMTSEITEKIKQYSKSDAQ